MYQWEAVKTFFFLKKTDFFLQQKEALVAVDFWLLYAHGPQNWEGWLDGDTGRGHFVARADESAELHHVVLQVPAQTGGGHGGRARQRQQPAIRPFQSSVQQECFLEDAGDHEL